MNRWLDCRPSQTSRPAANLSSCQTMNFVVARGRQESEKFVFLFSFLPLAALKNLHDAFQEPARKPAKRCAAPDRWPAAAAQLLHLTSFGYWTQSYCVLGSWSLVDAQAPATMQIAKNNGKAKRDQARVMRPLFQENPGSDRDAAISMPVI